MLASLIPRRAPARLFTAIAAIAAVFFTAATAATAALSATGALSASPATATTAAAAPAPSWLQVTAPPALAAEAARLRAIPATAFAAQVQLMGLAAPGPPIRVVLAPEGSPAARSAPAWIAGYALGDAGLVVLFPARSPTYPDASLDGVLRHEVAHVLAARAAGGQRLPRWFDEGLAMIAGSSWGMDDRARLTLALLLDRRTDLSGLDGRFAGGESEVAGAYAVSGAFVRDVVQRFGTVAPGRILAAVRTGQSFPAAFEAATGVPLAVAEAEFWSAHAVQRWLPLVTSSTLLWLGITALALYAVALRRRRDAARHAAWDAEEEAREDAAPRISTATDSQIPSSDTYQ